MNNTTTQDKELIKRPQRAPIHHLRHDHLYPKCIHSLNAIDALEHLEVIEENKPQYDRLITAPPTPGALFSMMTRFTPEKHIIYPSSLLTIEAKSPTKILINVFIRVRSRSKKALSDTSIRKESAEVTVEASRLCKRKKGSYAKIGQIYVELEKGEKITISLAEYAINYRKRDNLKVVDTVLYGIEKSRSNKTNAYFSQPNHENNPLLNGVWAKLTEKNGRYSNQTVITSIPLLASTINALTKQKAESLGMKCPYSDIADYYIQGTEDQIKDLTQYSKETLHTDLKDKESIESMLIYAKKRYVTEISGPDANYIDVVGTNYSNTSKAQTKIEAIVKEGILKEWSKETIFHKCSESVKPEDFIKQVNFRKKTYQKGTQHAKLLQQMGMENPPYCNWWIYTFGGRAAMYPEEIQITQQEFQDELQRAFTKLYKEFNLKDHETTIYTGFGIVHPNSHVSEFTVSNKDLQSIVLETFCIDTLTVRHQIDEQRTAALLETDNEDTSLVTITKEINKLYNVTRQKDDEEPEKMFKQIRGRPSRRYNYTTDEYTDIKQAKQRDLTVACVDEIYDNYRTKIPTKTGTITRTFGTTLDLQLNRIYHAIHGKIGDIALNSAPLNIPAYKILSFYKKTVEQHIENAIETLESITDIAIIHRGSKIIKIDLNTKPLPYLASLSQEVYDVACILSGSHNRTTENAAVFTALNPSIPAKNVTAALYKKRVTKSDIECKTSRYSKNTIMKKDHPLLDQLTQMPAVTRHELRSYSSQNPNTLELLYIAKEHQAQIVQYIIDKLPQKMRKIIAEIEESIKSTSTL